MLQIDDLTIRIGGRLLLDQASAFLAEGWKVGLVGRNGAGKSTLMRHIIEAAAGARDGRNGVRIAQRARVGHVAQEIPPSDRRLLDVVLDADTERAALLAALDTETDPERIGDIHMRLVDIDAHSAEARAAAVLAGLGFAPGDLDRASREFSGGWRMRAALAGVLFTTPELLLLDEPTNYLDLEGAAWLETYLKRYPGTVLLVSHDRDMLDRAVTHILALDKTKLSVHPGGYSAYLARRAEQMAQQATLAERQDAERKRLQAFVDRFRAKASKARQAQSRVKRLEKMEIITVPLADRTTPFSFAAGPELASPLMQLDGADLGYTAGAPVLRQVSLRLDADDRIAIIGPNGQGKTTLVKSISARLKLLGGARRASSALRIGYFSQDQLDELREGETPLDHVRTLMPNANTAQVRSVTAQIGFGPEKIETPVQNLSGGEKVRLLLGLIGLSKPHVMILDEPTSHLDVDSREALVVALNDFAGAVLIITHDVYLAEGCADRLWLVKDGRAEPYDGDLDDYRAMLAQSAKAERADRAARDRAARAEAAPSAPPAPVAVASPPTPRADPNARRTAAAARKALDTAEARVATAQKEVDALDAALADPAVFAGPAPKGPDLSRRRAEAAARLAEAEAAWLAAAEALEAAETAASL